ncbi:MAG: M48 family metalloprotease [Paracoccaceae bacterium]|jgi:predicted Zn-dependent protease
MAIPNLMLSMRVAALFSLITCAQLAQSAGLLRDSDIEAGLSRIAAPVLIAAGLSPVSTKVLVVDDDRLNAFVIDRHHIFLHSGLILRSTTPEMLQSVIAHEAAHIANGHIARRRQALLLSRNTANFGMALAVAVGAASDLGEAATGIALGVRGSATRKFLSHSRAEESSADQSALGYMVRSGINPMGMVETLDIFVGQENLVAGRQDPYVRSHPLTRDRMRSVATMAMAHDDLSSDPNMVYWHARVIGKLSAFQRAPSWTLGRINDSLSEDIKHMRTAIAQGREGKLTSAIKSIDRALALRPADPFYQDLKAELYMRNRAFSKSARSYKKAHHLRPKDAIILAGYGRALLAEGKFSRALDILEQARVRDFRNSALLRDLGVAYSKLGKHAMASLVSAERYSLQGRIKDAKMHANRAAAGLPLGSPAWQRAQDIIDIR